MWNEEVKELLKVETFSSTSHFVKGSDERDITATDGAYGQLEKKKIEHKHAKPHCKAKKSIKKRQPPKLLSAAQIKENDAFADFRGDIERWLGLQTSKFDIVTLRF
jgi:hypothetical protein